MVASTHLFNLGTLLEAIELGIYNHVRGDGREAVVTNNAVKIRAEDGRTVVATDITPFIGMLPGGKTTDEFTSEDASGSTSMAANIQEALELGKYSCKVMLTTKFTQKGMRQAQKPYFSMRILVLQTS